MSVLVKNPTAEAMRLTSGTPVGRVEPLGQWAQLSVTDRSSEDASDQAGSVCSTTSEEQESGEEDSRRLKLSEKLNVSGEDLTPEQTQIIRDCVLKAHDVFSLSERDRGEVDAVEHNIDTGDSPPIRQPMRRVLR